MPLPFLLPVILGTVAAAAGVTGVKNGVQGAVKMKDAQDTISEAKSRHERNTERFETYNRATNRALDNLGKLEMETLKSFEDFSNIIEKIINRPEFAPYKKNGVTLPKYDKEELQKVSVGAGVVLGGAGGALGGYAAAGAASTALVAVGSSIAVSQFGSLGGAALTNATLAALGGGALAAGGGGMALGTAILGASTLGIGLLVGGSIFKATGTKLSDQADEAWSQMKSAEEKIDKACRYLDDLKHLADKYRDSLETVVKKYKEYLQKITCTVNLRGKTDWYYFTDEERLEVEITAMLVGLLYNMCKVNLVNKSSSENEMNTINTSAAEKSMDDAKVVLQEVA